MVGDPTPIGWSITLVHALGAVLSVAAFSRISGPATKARVYWASLSILLAALALNKQLDLQKPLTTAGSWVAHVQGWYAYRGIVHVAFWAALTVAVLLAGFLLARLMSSEGPPAWVAYGGVVVLGVHLILRSASFDLWDARAFVGGLDFYPILELVGAALVSLGALAAARRGTGPPGIAAPEMPVDLPRESRAGSPHGLDRETGSPRPGSHR